MDKQANGMRRATERAIELLGGPAAAAKALDVTRTLPYYWLEQGRVPPERVLALEAATDARVTRYQLRPDVFGT